MTAAEEWTVWSNAAYIIGGLLLPQLVASPIGWAGGFAMVGLGVGSYLYHSGKVEWGQHADVLMMYVVGTLLLGAAFGLSDGYSAIALLIAGGLGGVYLRWHVSNRMEVKIGVLYLAVLVAASIRSRYLAADWRLIGIGSAVLLLALVSRFLWKIWAVVDHHPTTSKQWGKVPHPWSHGLWHVLAAAGLVFWFVGLAG